MSWEGWFVFAGFWAVFVITPGPNAVNCISVAMQQGFTRALWCVAAILTQAVLFMTLSAFGVTALIAASPNAFGVLRVLGAAFLIYLGVRGWMLASRPVAPVDSVQKHLYARALVIATVNPKSIAGYLAAFSQFVQPDVPVATQMWVILPTALSLTAASYTGYCALGAGLGHAALGAVFNTWFRRGLSVCFVIYGLLLGSVEIPGGR